MADYLTDLYTFTVREVEYFIKGLWRVHQLDPIVVTKKSFDSNRVLVSNGQRLRATAFRDPSESKQMAILKRLQRWQESKNHDNVIRILGVHRGLDIPRLIFVSDYAYPTVLEFLQNLNAKHVHPPEDNLKECAECIQIADFRLACCSQIASGLAFLHDDQWIPIIHGAVRGSNVLVKPDGICCLGEFSEERFPSESTVTRYANWMAPELVDLQNFLKLSVCHYESQSDPPYSGAYRKPSDVFALGCTCIEIYMDAPPAVLRINYDIFQDYSKVAQAHLNSPNPTEEEIEKIPRLVLSAIYSLLGYLPHTRRTAESARRMFEEPDIYRIPLQISITDKRILAHKVFRMIMSGKRYA